MAPRQVKTSAAKTEPAAKTEQAKTKPAVPAPSGERGTKRDTRTGTAFKPVKTRRIFEEICDSIRAKLVSGELKAGDRLPAERDLSEMFAVSRTAVREALRSLEIAGIVSLKMGSKGGAFITEGGVGQVTRSFRDMLDFGRVPLAALLEARLLVMDAVVRACCERAGPDDVEQMKRNVAETIELTKRGLYEERTLKAVEFSTIVANATGNPVLAAILEAMASVIRGFIVVSGPPAHDPLIRSRRRLIAQIAARDADGACRTMKSYLTSLNAHLLKVERESRATVPRDRAPKRTRAMASAPA